MTSNHRLTTREIPSSLNLSSPLDYWREYVQSILNVRGTDSWNHFYSTGTPFHLNVLSNLERLRPKCWSVNLLMKKVNGWEPCWDKLEWLLIVYKTRLLHRQYGDQHGPSIFWWIILMCFFFVFHVRLPTRQRLAQLSFVTCNIPLFELQTFFFHDSFFFFWKVV